MSCSVGSWDQYNIKIFLALKSKKFTLGSSQNVLNHISPMCIFDVLHSNLSYWVEIFICYLEACRMVYSFSKMKYFIRNMREMTSFTRQDSLVKSGFCFLSMLVVVTVTAIFILFYFFLLLVYVFNCLGLNLNPLTCLQHSAVTMFAPSLQGSLASLAKGKPQMTNLPNLCDSDASLGLGETKMSSRD